MNNSNVNFLFMDESFCQSTKISALVGLIVPTHKYPNLRERFYSILSPFSQPEPNVIASPPEVHGVELPGDTDEEKFRVASEIVDLVVASDMEVYRIGYYITKTVRATFKQDPEMLGVCWLSLLSMIQQQLSGQMVIPVMDGFDSRKVKILSAPIKFCDVSRNEGFGQSLSIKHTENILGEVFYADSLYSVFIQIVDIIAYLRKTIDLQNDGHTLSGFKKELLPLAMKLDPAISSEHIIAFTINDSIQGPTHRAKQPSGNGPLTMARTLTPTDSKD